MVAGLGQLPPRTFGARPVGLGVLARTIEAAPVASLTMLGAVLGGASGILAGQTAALLFPSYKTACMLAGAAIGAGTVGTEGYRRGKGVHRWLQLHK